MRLVSYRRDGAVRHGRLDGDDTVVELGTGDLGVLVAAVFPLREDTAPEGTGTYPLSDLELLPPLSRPGKLLAVAANYQDHVLEGGGEPLDKSRITPRLFLKPPTAIVGPGATVPLPDISTQVDWEAELSVVIGTRARNVPVEDALGVVAGYMTSNDVSARSVDVGVPTDSRNDKAVWFFEWLAGKWCDGFAPTGPWLVTADEVGDPQTLPVELAVNGVVRQNGSTKDMIFSVAELIAHASRLMTLEPGDVIMTGTPSGVGAASGTYLQAGDVMTVTVGPLGTLQNPVA
jgi:2-keto-4-pentenoate hydratase/2-oxohepta-3-ene-1,7-dioic acid hydratase in catechol pathway